MTDETAVAVVADAQTEQVEDHNETAVELARIGADVAEVNADAAVEIAHAEADASVEIAEAHAEGNSEWREHIARLDAEHARTVEQLTTIQSSMAEMASAIATLASPPSIPTLPPVEETEAEPEAMLEPPAVEGGPPEAAERNKRRLPWM